MALGYDQLLSGQVQPPAPTAPSSSGNGPVDLGGLSGLTQDQLNAITAQKYAQGQQTSANQLLAGGNYQGAQAMLPSGANPAGGSPAGYTAPQQSLTDIINGFPGVTNALALEQQGLGQLDAQLQAQRERLITNYGDPSLAAMAGFGLDPQAGAFAQQNYLSGNATLARLDQAHKQAAQAVINGLASHGILNSGDLGYQEGQENTNYGHNVYDAQQSVLDQLANLYSNYLGQKQTLQQSPISAMLQALGDYLNNPDAYAALTGSGNTGSTTTTNSTPPKTTSTNPKALGGSTAAASKALAAGYNPAAYVPGGSSKKIGTAIQKSGGLVFSG